MAFLCMCCPVYVVYVRLGGPISDAPVEVYTIADEVCLPDAWLAMLEFCVSPRQVFAHPTDIDSPNLRLSSSLLPSVMLMSGATQVLLWIDTSIYDIPALQSFKKQWLVKWFHIF